MDNSLKGLILAAGVIITCIVVGLGFFISREAKNASDKGTNQLVSMSSQYDNIEFTMYDGLKVSGKEVVNVIRKHADDIDIRVTPLDSKAEVKIYRDMNGELPEKGDADYINPSALFLGQLVKNSNNELLEIRFVQK